MLNDLYEILKESLKKLLASRTFILGVFFVFLFGILAVQIFRLQIIEGEEYQENYMTKTKKTIMLAGTRGNIYDRNGNLLAYNQLAYNVTIQDNGDYTTTAERNRMLLLLVQILNRHGEKVRGEFAVAIEPSGEMVYTTSSETARKRFISDYYGLKSPSELDAEDGSTPSDITPREMFDAKFKDYGLDKLTDEDGDPVTLTDEEALGIINIRYTMGFTAYQKYMTTTIASNVSRETMTDVLENSADLKGVAIEETTLRVYNDSVYFAPIIGYTGKVWDDELEKLKETNPDYELTDLVGKTGIEASMEPELQGKKGSQTMYVNSTGRIVEIVEKTDPKAGNDVYLTIDRDLQIDL